jgi:hypothetical protein
VRTTIVLCDYATVSENKLTLVGGGWHWCGASAPGYYLAVFLEIEQVTEERVSDLTLDLVDQNEQIVATSSLEIQLRPGLGETIPAAVLVPPMQLETGSSYEWRAYVDGEGDQEWVCRFKTRGVA